MKVKIIKNTVLDGSVWFAGDVADLPEEIAQMAIRQGNAELVDKPPKDQGKK